MQDLVTLNNPKLGLFPGNHDCAQEAGLYHVGSINRLDDVKSLTPADAKLAEVICLSVFSMYLCAIPRYSRVYLGTWVYLGIPRYT